MPDALTCAVCGASVPHGRSRCGRCGAPTKVPAVTVAPELPATGGRPIWFTAAAGVMVAGGVAIAVLRGTPEPVAQAQPAPVATSPTPGQPVAPAGRAPIPAPVFAGADAFREGVASYSSGDMASAVARFTAAIEADPNNADALNNLGQALVRSGRAREAIPYFDRALALAGTEWSYHFNRARAYGELKEWRRAVTGYTDAARLFPDDYVTQFNLAKARQAAGDMPGALQAYAKATELAPGQADFHLSYGQALDSSGRAREAAVEYRRFLELDSSASQAEKVRARLTELGEAPAAASS